MGIHIHAKLLLVLATAFSTAVSLVGGVVLYLESISAMEKTVREGATFELIAARDPLKSTLDEAILATESRMELLHLWHPFRTPEELLEWTVRDTYTVISKSDQYAIGVVAVLNQSSLGPDDKASGLKVTTWWDPLSDPEYIENNFGHDKFYMYAYTTPGLRNVPCQTNKTSPQCNVGIQLDPRTGRDYAHAYNYTNEALDVFHPHGPFMARFPNWRTEGATSWETIWVWYGPDSTPYQFGEYISVRALPPDPGHPVFSDVLMIVKAQIVFYEWPSVLLKLGLQGYVLAVSGGEVVLATSRGEKMTRECVVSNDNTKWLNEGPTTHPCAIRVGDLGARTEGAVSILSHTEDSVFLRKDVEGTEMWLMRRTIFTPGKHDQMKEVFLAWMRSVSDVQDQLLRPLLFFIGFIILILVFDVLVVIVEIRNIGHPLATLVKAIQKVDNMDLQGATAELNKQVVDGCFGITDIRELWRGFHCMLASLTEYRSYLPHAVLPQGYDFAFEELELRDIADADKAMVSEYTGIGDNTGSPLDSSPKNLGAQSPTSFAHTSAMDSVRDVSESHSSSSSERVPRRVLVVSAARNLPLEKRQVSVAVFNMLNTLRTEVDRRKERIGGMVALCINEAATANGVLDGVVGDRARCSWNASRPGTRHRVHALSAALRASQGGMSSAVASGEAICGAGGSDDFRFFLIDGPKVALAFLLERVAAHEARQLSCSNLTLCDNVTFADTQAFVHHRWYATVLHLKVNVNPLHVWHAVDLKGEKQGEEWMYLLVKEDVWDSYNRAVLKLTEGGPGLEEAEKIMKGLPEKLSPLERECAFRLREDIRDKRAPKVQQLMDFSLAPMSEDVRLVTGPASTMKGLPRDKSGSLPTYSPRGPTALPGAAAVSPSLSLSNCGTASATPVSQASSVL
eukprot:Hpha_TRINITY_DN15709_c8_g1::TRINITY_DN15709_c8_g1_i1::g.37375::m.37375